MKKTLLVIFAIVSLKITSCSYSQSPLTDKELKEVLKEKANLTIKGPLNIKKFESQQSVGPDYFERYEIQLSQSQINNILLTIRTSDKIGWEKIERGYDHQTLNHLIRQLLQKSLLLFTYLL